MNVCVIEDEKNILRLVEYDLKHAGFNVDSFDHGLKAKQSIIDKSYDAYVIDWMLPQVSGIELVKLIREKDYDAIIIMLTAKDEESDILEAFETGVDDYITKPFSPRELMARLKAHTRRIQPKSEEKLMFHDIDIDMLTRKITIASKDHLFTKKEFDLFVYFVNNRNIVLSRDDILNELWNFDYDGDTRIVDVHVFKLRNKLENSLCTIESVRGVGYVLQAK